MPDKYDEYLNRKRLMKTANPTPRVALILIAVFVVGMVFWVSGQ